MYVFVYGVFMGVSVCDGFCGRDVWAGCVFVCVGGVCVGVC